MKEMGLKVRKENREFFGRLLQCTVEPEERAAWPAVLMLPPSRPGPGAGALQTVGRAVKTTSKWNSSRFLTAPSIAEYGRMPKSLNFDVATASTVRLSPSHS